MKVTKIVATMALCGCWLMAAGTLNAQMGDVSKSGQMVTAQSPAQALDDLLSMYEHEAMGVVNAMPADKYSFAPNAANFAPEQGAKFDGVRTFAAQVTHVAEANYYFYMSVSGMKPDVDMKSIETLTKKEDCVAILAKSFAFAHKAIATITMQNAFEPIKPVDGMKTRASLAAFGVAHGYDHYGQMVEYLRMNGVVPPGSK
jgi:uncharacterized damage-inducible protein DinB